jgi:alpha/beta superfamily hydrolase
LKQQRDTNTKYVIIHGTKDKVIPVQDSHGIYEALNKRKTSLVQVDGANHTFEQHTADIVSILARTLLHTASKL